MSSIKESRLYPNILIRSLISWRTNRIPKFPSTTNKSTSSLNANHFKNLTENTHLIRVLLNAARRTKGLIPYRKRILERIHVLDEINSNLLFTSRSLLESNFVVVQNMGILLSPLITDAYANTYFHRSFDARNVGARNRRNYPRISTTQLPRP